jgi:hypothetical protein
MGMFDDVLKNVGEPYKGASKGFEYGTHKVQILLAEPQQKKTAKDPKAEVIVVSVVKPEDKDQTNVAEATLYYHTEGGARMSVTKVLGLLVHKSGEDKKDAVRALGKKLFEQIDDPTTARDVAAKLINEKLIDQEAFAFADPQGKYKTTNYVDLWHYAYEDPNADDRADKAADVEGTELEGEEGEELKEAFDAFDDL